MTSRRLATAALLGTAALLVAALKVSSAMGDPLGGNKVQVSDTSGNVVDTSLVASKRALKVDVVQSVSSGSGSSGATAIDGGYVVIAGGAKGATASALITATAEGADHQAVDVQLYSGGAAVNPTQIRALTSADTVSVTDGAGPLTVDGTVTANQGGAPWSVSGSGNFTVVQATAANLNATCSAGTNLNTSALALDATLTGGTQKAIARGAAKGASAAADVTATAEGADHSGLDVQLYSGGVAVNPTQIRALTSSDTVSVTDGAGPLTVDGTVTTSPPANASTNVAQLAGTTCDTNSGSKSAGTLRVVIATDQPALTNKLLVTPDSVALPANQSVNVAQINGVTTLMGSGATGTGSIRVTPATDSPTYSTANGTISTQSALSSTRAVAYGSSPTAVGAGNNGPAIGDLEGREYVNTSHPRSINCFVSTTATTSTQITGCEVVASNSIYITSITLCGDIASATANAATLQSGTSTTCTGPHILFACYHAALGCCTSPPFINPIKATVAEGLCILDGVTGTKKAMITGYVAP